MAFQHGKSINVLSGGYDITGFLNKIDTPMTADVTETSVFGLDDKTFIPGLLNATMTGDGFYSSAPSPGLMDQIDDIMSACFGGSQILSWYPAGYTRTNSGYGMLLTSTAYNTMATIDNAVKIAIGGQSSAARENLVSLHTLKAETVDGSETYYDLGVGGGTKGGSAYLHVTAKSGTIDTLKIEHSTDHITYTDLVAFTAPTAIGAQRVTFSGTVNRYVRVTWAGETSYSVTFQVGIYKKV